MNSRISKSAVGLALLVSGKISLFAAIAIYNGFADVSSISTFSSGGLTFGGLATKTRDYAAMLGFVTVALLVFGYVSWTFDPNNRAVSGKHDAIGALEHEISEGMFGRFGDLASDGQYSLFDLFRYTSSGVRGLTPGPGFFSIDGTHLLTQYNNPNNGGDAADWLPSIVGDSFGSSYSGVISAVNPVDLKTLDVAGWNRAPATTTDFTGDAFSDLLFRDATSGTFTEWASTAGRFTANAYVNSVNTAWNLAGSGDFNGDSISDVIWRNATDGTFTEWQSTGSGFTQNVYVDGTVSTAYALAAIGDFNGDGKSDLLWRNASTGLLTEWQSNGNAFTQNVYVNGTMDNTWNLAGTGDFNGDGKTDIFFRNTSTGLFTEWQSTGNGFTPNAYVNSTMDNTWTLAGTGDFNGDGNNDLLFRNTSTGQITEWQSTGNGFTPNAYSDSTVGTAWTLAAVSDFNGDGKSDLLWRNTSAGIFTEWQSTGNAFTPNIYIDSSVATNWILNSSSTHLLS